MIVFPMVGMSRRFSEAGYPVPKFMLPLAGTTCFDLAVAGFMGAFAPEDFLFVTREAQGTPDFVRQRLSALGLARARVVTLAAMTKGQADSVEQGIADLPDEAELTVFNIDTFRPAFHRPPSERTGDGYLEVFVGSGSNWSFVEPSPQGDGRALRTTEKDPISDLCSTGLYHFRRVGLFRTALHDERRVPSSPLGEEYIAPIYNQLIRGGSDIRYVTIPREDVVFCGVPAEYESLRRDHSAIQRLADGLAPA